MAPRKALLALLTALGCSPPATPLAPLDLPAMPPCSPAEAPPRPPPAAPSASAPPPIPTVDLSAFTSRPLDGPKHPARPAVRSKMLSDHGTPTVLTHGRTAVVVVGTDMRISRPVAHVLDRTGERRHELGTCRCTDPGCPSPRETDLNTMLMRCDAQAAALDRDGNLFVTGDVWAGSSLKLGDVEITGRHAPFVLFSDLRSPARALVLEGLSRPPWLSRSTAGTPSDVLLTSAPDDDKARAFMLGPGPRASAPLARPPVGARVVMRDRDQLIVFDGVEPADPARKLPRRSHVEIGVPGRSTIRLEDPHAAGLRALPVATPEALWVALDATGVGEREHEAASLLLRVALSGDRLEKRVLATHCEQLGVCGVKTMAAHASGVVAAAGVRSSNEREPAELFVVEIDRDGSLLRESRLPMRGDCIPYTFSSMSLGLTDDDVVVAVDCPSSRIGTARGRAYSDPTTHVDRFARARPRARP